MVQELRITIYRQFRRENATPPPKKERDMNLIPTSSLIIPKYQSKS